MSRLSTDQKDLFIFLSLSEKYRSSGSAAINP